MDDIYETIYWFIIDTDHPHATLFDDELAAHITGLVGDCKRGLRIAECARLDSALQNRKGEREVIPAIRVSPSLFDVR